VIRRERAERRHQFDLVALSLTKPSTPKPAPSTQGGSTMSTVIMQRWDAVTPAQYDQIREIVGWDVDVPAGMTFHVASFDGDILRMLDIWDSEEQFMTFVQTRIMPAVAQVGMAGQPDMIVTPMHDLFSSVATHVAA
jgi:hypothetical protein